MTVKTLVEGWKVADPGDTAVTWHCPAARAVMTAPLSTQGPVSVRVTVAPEAAEVVRVVFEPVCTTIGAAIDHGAIFGGSMTIVSLACGGKMLIDCDEVPLAALPTAGLLPE